MSDALYIGATAMQAQQAHVDAIANNLANVTTPGFKKGRISFADLVVSRGSTTHAGMDSPAPLQAAGVGVRIAAAARVFEGGEIKKTDAPLDIAIVGDGFFELAMPDGSRAYARGGTLKVNADGLLAHQGGSALKPGIAIPEDAEALLVSASGRVRARLPGQAAEVDIGQLDVVRFSNPQGLVSQGANMYRASDASGDPIGGRAGEDGIGTLAQGFLEGSNVKLLEEMVDLMVAQRAYEAGVKVVQASDEMLGMINALRK
ncbi:MAG: flagellar basal-body rod protein FlgG [Comamonadaceae bacterium]|nr:MAG: flagellar basal-body rod protein FlgG [Comamonadaceae bacterium]